ncbi:MraY family glycosyltransferase [Bacillus mexicanus]|uniref:glycosyltransferase family 4 protein n=1 Tax=Bacillus mexicanus TaxID=2834415 RepID=UPI003D254615
MIETLKTINMTPFITIFIVSFFLALITTPLAIKIGLKLGIVDFPDKRKVHKKIMPRSGGIGVFIAFFVSYILSELIFNPFTNPVFIHFLVCCVLIFSLGITDDKFNLPAKLKFVVQTLIAIYFSVFVYSIHSVHLPFFDHPIQLGLLSIPITVLWIVGITNAFNLIDGLDGLASGVAGISSLTFFFVALSLGNVIVAFLSLILSGTLFGFLFFNSHPAKVFLGDSGSLFIGFFMAVVSVLELKQVAVVSFITPIMIFFIPISDTIYAIVRRKLNKQPIFQPDKSHLHHCLLSLGFSHRTTVWIIYSFCLFFSIGAFVSIKIAVELSVVLLLVYLAGFQIFAKKIGMFPKLRRKISEKN